MLCHFLLLSSLPFFLCCLRAVEPASEKPAKKPVRKVCYAGHCADLVTMCCNTHIHSFFYDSISVFHSSSNRSKRNRKLEVRKQLLSHRPLQQRRSHLLQQRRSRLLPRLRQRLLPLPVVEVEVGRGKQREKQPWGSLTSRLMSPNQAYQLVAMGCFLCVCVWQ